MSLYTRTKDPYSPIVFPDGRTFQFQEVKGWEIDESERIYALCIELMEHKAQHMHFVECVIFWNYISNDVRRPEGKKLFEYAKKQLIPHMASWRWPEGAHRETRHCFRWGKPEEVPI